MGEVHLLERPKQIKRKVNEVNVLKLHFVFTLAFQKDPSQKSSQQGGNNTSKDCSENIETVLLYNSVKYRNFVCQYDRIYKSMFRTSEF